ncbi:MAG TPA: hypothetical protein DD490_28935, partial [Acidobacteria bacterium]|nr:hypothetical protein [Acidobacteriota bacterium]
RTPMNAILGMTTLLETTRLTPEQGSYLATLRSSSEELLALIGRVLDYSEMESGGGEVERAPFSPATVLRESLAIIAPLAERKGLELHQAVTPGAPEMLIGDGARTRQILLLLLDNAVKFTPRGEVRVKLTFRPLEGKRWEACFAVTDTGIGIEPENLERLFAAFHQLESSLTREHGGAGLGLALAKRLTEILGGTLCAESMPGRGSTFFFTLVGEGA